jgi:predicted small metal-binding protein
MAYLLYCHALGQDCNYMTSAESCEEVLRRLLEHARIAHGLDNLPEHVSEGARGAVIHDRHTGTVRIPLARQWC